MALSVFDYRVDVRNIFVSSAMRSRFLKFEAGTISGRHSHDLGHEIFIVMSGRGEFEIDGEKAELGPGQACIARRDQHHTVRVLGDEPMTIYLSVTPHIQPTHTMWTGDGWADDSVKLPHRFVPNSAYDVEADTSTPTLEVLKRCLAASDEVTAAVLECNALQNELVSGYISAMEVGSKISAIKARDAIWDLAFRVLKSVDDWGEIWNSFAARSADENS